MKLALKLVFVFMLGNILLATIYGYVAVERETRRFEQIASDEAQRLGLAMEQLLADAWQHAGHEGLVQMVRKADGHAYQMHIQWVWFDREPGTPFSPAVMSHRLTTMAVGRPLLVEGPGPDGNPYLYAYWPVTLTTQRKGGLEFSRPLLDLQANREDVILHTAALIGGMLLLSGLLAVVWGVRIVGRPLRQLTGKTRQMAAGDLTTPLHLNTRDELAELAESLNQMCHQLMDSQAKIREEAAAKIAAIEELRHADRLNTVGRLAAGIAHELGTPLNVVAGRAGLIASGKLTPEDTAISAAAIKAEADKMTTIIRQLLDFARRRTPQKTSTDLRQVVRQTADLLGALAEKQHVRLCVAPSDEPAMADADVGQIQQVLTNLMVNAIQAMPHGGQIDVVVRHSSAPAPQKPGKPNQAYCCVDVRDQGEGIAEQHLPHLFEPFFTTKDVGEGTGLGLSIAYGLVQEHGGWIEVHSRPGQGSCFTVYLPESAKP